MFDNNLWLLRGLAWKSNCCEPVEHSFDQYMRDGPRNPRIKSTYDAFSNLNCFIIK